MEPGAAASNLSSTFDALWRTGVVGGLTDGELLDRFLTGRHGVDEDAFTALVERHGPMVLRICRQILGDTDEAQDAFQATFLVFVRRASSIRKRNSLASWLHGVARRVSRRTRVDAARRRKYERLGAAKAMETRDDQSQSGSWPELHDAIAGLPERYREPTVLCYLEGMSTEAAALRIGCPQGTILSRLSRARERLRHTLTRQGLTVPAGFLATGVLADSASAAVPASLLVATVQSSLMFAGRRTAVASLASSASVVLARGVLSTMTISKIKVLGAVTLAGVLALVGGVQTFGQFGGTGSGEEPAAEASRGSDPRTALKRAVADLQAALDEANRRNGELQKQLLDIRAKLEVLSAEAKPDMTPKPEIEERGGKAGPSEVPKAEAEGINKFTTAPQTSEMPVPESEVQPKEDLRYFRNGQFIVSIPPGGAKITTYDMETSKAKSFRLIEPKAPGLEVVPIIGPGSVALMLKGKKITRIAATPSLGQAWYPLDLREPVSGQAVPIVGPQAVVYSLDHFVYAFSPQVCQWDVLRVPDGITASPVVDQDAVTLEGKGHIFTFSCRTGKWKDLDLNAILKDAPEDEAEKVSAKK